MIFDLLVGNVYAPTNSATTPVTYLSVGNLLPLSQQVAKNIRTRRTGNRFNLVQSVAVQKSIANLTVGNTLLLTQRVGPAPIEISALNGLMMWDRAYANSWFDLTSLLTLTQTLAGGASKGMASQTAFMQTVNCQVIRNIAVGNQLAQSPHASITTSEGSRFVMPVIPIVAPATKVTFTFGTFTFQVRKPDFDNSEKLEFSRISRRSRGGDLIIYRDPMWPESITLKMKFSLLSTAEKDLFKYLFLISLGQLVRYDDYLGQAWSGIILNPGEPLVQYGIGDRFQTSIELQGGRI